MSTGDRVWRIAKPGAVGGLPRGRPRRGRRRHRRRRQGRGQGRADRRPRRRGARRRLRRVQDEAGVRHGLRRHVRRAGPAGLRRPLSVTVSHRVGAPRLSRRALRTAAASVINRAMRSRWNDAEAGKLSELDLLVYASRLSAPRPRSSCGAAATPRSSASSAITAGARSRVLRVKGSGSDLKSIQRKDFPGVRMDDILALLERDDMGDQEMVDYLAHAPPGAGRRRGRRSRRCCTASSPRRRRRPHPRRRDRVAHQQRPRRDDARATCTARTSSRSPYRRPGFRISQGRGRHDRSRIPRPRALAAREARHDQLGRDREGGVRGDDRAGHRAEDAIARAPPRARGSSARRACACAEPGRAPRAWRSRWRPRCAACSAATGASIVTLRRLARRARVRSSREAPALSQVGPGHARPHDLHEAPAVLRADGHARRSRGGARGRRRGGRATASSRDYTRVLRRPQVRRAPCCPTRCRAWSLVPGLGMFTAGKDRRTAGIVSDIYHHTIDVIGNAAGVRPLRVALRRRTPSTSSTGRSSSTSSRWRRPRRSWPGGSRW